MVKIVYDSGPVMALPSKFPVLNSILEKYDLSFFDPSKQNSSGQIKNTREIRLGGRQMWLGELSLSTLHYLSICTELEVNNDPCIFIDDLKCIVLLKR